MTRPDDLPLVCKLLNAAEADYLLVGGQAAILHGVVRSTKDIDILVRKTLPNLERTLAALGGLPYQIAREIDPELALNKPCTVIGDDPRVDILTVAQGVPFADAWERRCEAQVDGVRIPYASLDDLILMKQTSRLQDQADVAQLQRLKALRNPGLDDQS